MTGARMVPGLDQLALLPTPLNPGELATAAALAQLGSGWQVFVQPRLAMAQPDFIVMHPDKGVWFIKAKDCSPSVYPALAVTVEEDRWATAKGSARGLLSAFSRNDPLR